MRVDDRLRLRHMLDAIDAAREFVSGRTAAELQTDRMRLFAVVRAVEVIGEAASRVSTPTRDLAPEIPWTLITAMRNRLIHGYFDVDPDIVWATVTQELTALVPLLTALLERVEQTATD